MVAGTQSCGSQCYDFLIEPFHQGYCNIYDAIFSETKTQTVAQNVLGQAAPPEPFSLSERISKIVIGTLLIIPVINAIVMTILKGVQSKFLYMPSAATPERGMPPAPMPGGGMPPAAPIPGGPGGCMPPAPMPPRGMPPAPIPGGILHPAPVIPDFPIADIPDEPAPPALTPEEMIARKTEALTRLDRIEQMIPEQGNPVAALAGSFECTQDILDFDLNALLQRYRTNHGANRLLEFMDWAEVPDDNRFAFRMAIQRYGIANDHNAERGVLIEGFLKNLAAYFNHHSARVTGEAEIHLKEQFREVYDSIIDANNNCIDQVLSQVQMLALNVIAEGATSQGTTSSRKVIAQAGLAVCKYRVNLLKDILTRQNPDERHMADLERVAIERLAGPLHLRGAIFGAGAHYGGILGNVEGRIQNAINVFLEGDAETEKYDPVKYLLQELQTNVGTGNLRLLRGEMMIWAGQHYDWNTQDANAADQLELMDRRMSEDFDALSIMVGGNLTPAATALLMEKLGFVTEAPPVI